MLSTDRSLRHYLKLLAIPTTLLLTFLSLAVVWRLFNLPSTEVLGEMAGNWFALYGLPVVFVAAFLEGLILIGNYFPGAFIIVLGVVLSGSLMGALGVLVVGTVGLMLSHALNYYLGKYGWYRLFQKFGLGNSINESREKLIKKGGYAIFFTYWNPSMAAVVDTAAGVIRMNLKKFLLVALVSSIFWNTVVASIAYSLKDRALDIVSPGSPDLRYILIIFVIWSGVVLFLDWRKKRKVPSQSKSFSGSDWNKYSGSEFRWLESVLMHNKISRNDMLYLLDTFEIKFTGEDWRNTTDQNEMGNILINDVPKEKLWPMVTKLLKEKYPEISLAK